MKVVVLVRGDVSGWYATTLMERGHEVAIHGGGAIHGPLIKDYANYDGCLLLGSDPDRTRARTAVLRVYPVCS